MHVPAVQTLHGRTGWEILSVMTSQGVPLSFAAKQTPIWKQARPAGWPTIDITVPPVGWLCTHSVVRQDPVICFFTHCSQTRKSSDYQHAGLLSRLAIPHHQGRQCNLSYLIHSDIVHHLQAPGQWPVYTHLYMGPKEANAGKFRCSYMYTTHSWWHSYKRSYIL